MSALTYLFVPGNRPERFAKALAIGADRVILDLEDAVLPVDKPQARKAIANWVSTLDAMTIGCLLVRINDAASPWHGDDLTWLPGSQMAHAMLSKCEHPDQVATVCAHLPAQGTVVPLVETVRGILAASAIAQAPRVERLAFGSLDYLLDLDLPGPGFALDSAATTLAMASRASGLPAPIAGVTAALDAPQVLAELAHARSLGFGAKMCIHPSQVPIVREAFRPDSAALEWAHRIVTAWQQCASVGAIQVDGKMVDKPVLLRAERILAQAGQSL
jgi:citrate lyase subunit beta/citryl-CoA lyase